MKVWRQAFSVQRVPTTLNAQRLQTLNLPIMAAQPQSLTPRSGKVIEAPARSSVMRVVLLSIVFSQDGCCPVLRVGGPPDAATGA
ncbi:MAG: hypothetical protein M0Q87_09815 [Ottowia sp.]|nr:hypothetical protein [Ottowia sp.]